MSKRKLTFEDALKQLETLAEQIERGEIGLEESLEKYEEGMSLARQCREILQDAERKIQTLQEKADGMLEIGEYTPSADLGAEPKSEK